MGLNIYCSFVTNFIWYLPTVSLSLTLKPQKNSRVMKHLILPVCSGGKGRDLWEQLFTMFPACRLHWMSLFCTGWFSICCGNLLWLLMASSCLYSYPCDTSICSAYYSFQTSYCAACMPTHAQENNIYKINHEEEYLHKTTHQMGICLVQNIDIIASRSVILFTLNSLFLKAFHTKVKSFCRSLWSEKWFTELILARWTCRKATKNGL